jgi:hypothetical protein
MKNDVIDVAVFAFFSPLTSSSAASMGFLASEREFFCNVTTPERMEDEERSQKNTIKILCDVKKEEKQVIRIRSPLHSVARLCARWRLE